MGSAAKAVIEQRDLTWLGNARRIVARFHALKAKRTQQAKPRDTAALRFRMTSELRHPRSGT
jgi:hypothetical protein